MKRTTAFGVVSALSGFPMLAFAVGPSQAGSGPDMPTSIRSGLNIPDEGLFCPTGNNKGPLHAQPSFRVSRKDIYDTVMRGIELDHASQQSGGYPKAVSAAEQDAWNLEAGPPPRAAVRQILVPGVNADVRALYWYDKPNGLAGFYTLVVFIRGEPRECLTAGEMGLSQPNLYVPIEY